MARCRSHPAAVGGGDPADDDQAVPAGTVTLLPAAHEGIHGRRQARPPVDDLQAGGAGLTAEAHLHLPTPVLDRVGDEIADRLGQPQPLTAHLHLGFDTPGAQTHVAGFGKFAVVLMARPLLMIFVPV